jgi:hypothetical protein
MAVAGSPFAKDGPTHLETFWRIWAKDQRAKHLKGRITTATTLRVIVFGPIGKPSLKIASTQFGLLSTGSGKV